MGTFRRHCHTLTRMWQCRKSVHRFWSDRRSHAGSQPAKKVSALELWSHHRRMSMVIIVVVLIVMQIFYMHHSGDKKHENVFSPFPISSHLLVSRKPSTALFPYLIEENSKCASGPPFLLLLISSRPQEGQTRNALRKTWANEMLLNEVNITKLFLLGRPVSNVIQEKVREESLEFHDIIQQDFIDSYNNLTLKTLMGMDWVSHLCPNVPYVMKIDSDMFFNPWFLVEKLLQHKKLPRVNFFTGQVIVGGPPHRDKNSKWYMSFSDYPKHIYPPYCTGEGYIFSGDLAEKIYVQAKCLRILPFEDVFVGICLKRIGVKIYRPVRNWFIGKKIQYNRCQFSKLVIVHSFTPEELLKIWPDFVKAVKTCG